MQRLLFWTGAMAAAWAGALGASTQGATFTTTFENVGLAAEIFDNNAGPAGQFVVDGHAFNNDFDPQFGVWSGWALSTMTDNTTPGFTNQYSAITGSGSGGSQTYAVGFPFSFITDPLHPADSIIDLMPGTNPLSIDVTNTTYAYFSMLEGDGFSKQFEAGDYLLLDVRGYDTTGGVGNLIGTVEFYLANFLDGNSSIVDTWQTVDLSSLSGAASLRFGLRSTDIGNFGVNTPTYFAIDNFQVLVVPEPSTGGLMLVALVCVGAWCRRWRRG